MSHLPSPAPFSVDPAATGALVANAPIGSHPKSSQNARLWAQAQNFEVQFVNSMFQQMYAGIQGDGPFGNSMGAAPFRSFLTEQFAKKLVKSGGLGIANEVYRSILAHQEAQAKQGPPLKQGQHP